MKVDKTSDHFLRLLQGEASTFNKKISMENGYWGNWIVRGSIRMDCLPVTPAHVGVPPIKCQGIKTKLVPFLLSNIVWDSNPTGRWIEPFLGSGVVAMNLAPPRALLADTNRHIIALYQAIQSGEVNRSTPRDHLEAEGSKLAAGKADYYYEVRERFNTEPTPLDFLFLNRSCFNGVMRFNRQGKFNVPFGHKPERFAKSYVTKIVNQVGWVAKKRLNLHFFWTQPGSY